MKSFQASFERLLKTGEDSDVTVQVEDHKFHLHALLLRQRSPFFKAQLAQNSGWSETATGTVKIQVSQRAFSLLLPFIYLERLDWKTSFAPGTTLRSHFYIDDDNQKWVQSDILDDAQIVRASDESKRAWIRFKECDQVVPLSFLSQPNVLSDDKDQPAEQSPSSLSEFLEMFELANFLQIEDFEAYVTQHHNDEIEGLVVKELQTLAADAVYSGAMDEFLKTTLRAAAFLRKPIDKCLLELCQGERALKEGEFEFYRFELDGNALGLLLLAGDYGLSSSSTYIAGYLQDGNELRTNFSEELSEEKIKFAVDKFGGPRVVDACWKIFYPMITKPGQFAGLHVGCDCN